MKKYLIAMTVAIGMTSAFVGCSKDKDVYDDQRVQEQAHSDFRAAFIAQFGQPASTVDWGFSESRANTARTRAGEEVEPKTIEEVLALTPVEVADLSETARRTYLKQLAEADGQLVARLDIDVLRAYGFKRIIAEDLAVTENSDFDYNDAVFDAKRVEDAGSGEFATYMIVLRATGAQKSIVVGNAEGAFEVHALFGVPAGTFVNTVNKVRPTRNGAYWEADHEAVYTSIKVHRTPEGEPLLIDIPVYADGSELPLTAERGEPAEKMCVDTDYSWLQERKHMAEWYPTFSHYVDGTLGVGETDEFVSEVSWWHLYYWDGNEEVVPTEAQQLFARTYFTVGGSSSMVAFADSAYPEASTTSGLQGVETNPQALTGGMNFISITSDVPYSRFYIGVEGQQGYWTYIVRNADVTRQNGRYVYSIPVNYGTEYNSDIDMLISGVQQSDGETTQPHTAHVSYVTSLSGDLNLNLTFSNAKDVDLHLYTPSGRHIYYGARGGTATVGGRSVTFGLDHDSNAGCHIDNLNNENIYIPAELIETGTYRVVVDMYSNCVRTTATSWSCVARYRGSVVPVLTGANPALGTYQAGAGNGDMSTVMTFYLLGSDAQTVSNRLVEGKFSPIKRTDLDEMKMEEAGFRVEQ